MQAVVSEAYLTVWLLKAVFDRLHHSARLGGNGIQSSEKNHIACDS